MPNSSPRAYNGSNATSNMNAAINNAVDGHDPSYSLSRFLNDMDQKLVPEYGQSQSHIESEKTYTRRAA
ncbi:hypothetical protein A0O28_0092350 [Trichoderma guizhouense]|uniref:Uncharacterized protein n=1 Tax=Trichoderma guizhouense TaxID=1491466 RepID=A0A1T3CX19_9HYPO|nr:hypothetical protein A0O28_0092350 [Trichoderma guizhouense]